VVKRTSSGRQSRMVWSRMTHRVHRDLEFIAGYTLLDIKDGSRRSKRSGNAKTGSGVMVVGQFHAAAGCAQLPQMVGKGPAAKRTASAIRSSTSPRRTV